MGEKKILFIALAFLFIQLFIFSEGTFHNGLASVKYNGKEGLIDKTGKFVVKPIYKSIIYNNFSLVSDPIYGYTYYSYFNNGKFSLNPFRG